MLLIEIVIVVGVLLTGYLGWNLYKKGWGIK